MCFHLIFKSAGDFLTQKKNGIGTWVVGSSLRDDIIIEKKIVRLFWFVKQQLSIDYHATRIKPSIFTGKEQQAHHRAQFHHPVKLIIMYFICNLINCVISRPHNMSLRDYKLSLIYDDYHHINICTWKLFHQHLHLNFSDYIYCFLLLWTVGYNELKRSIEGQSHRSFCRWFW